MSGGRYGRSRYIKDHDQDYDEGDIVWKSTVNHMEERDRESTQINPNPTSRKIPTSSSSSYMNDKLSTKQFSAPLNIPDWSKIYGKRNTPSSSSSSSSSSWVDDHGVIHHAHDDHDHDVDGHNDDMMIPPHEYIARKQARTQISSFSVCEGIGRTLKGRDLRKVRNSILTSTGFLE